MKFHSILEVRKSIAWGKEVVFRYQEKEYGIFYMDDSIWLTQGEREFSFPMDDGKTLREVITEVDMISRLI